VKKFCRVVASILSSTALFSGSANASQIQTKTAPLRPQVFAFTCPNVTPDPGVYTTTSLVNVRGITGRLVSVTNSSNYTWEVGGGEECTDFGTIPFESITFDYGGLMNGDCYVILIGTDKTGASNDAWYRLTSDFTSTSTSKTARKPKLPAGFQQITITPTTPVVQGTTLATVSEIQIYFFGDWAINHDEPGQEPNVMQAIFGALEVNGKAAPPPSPKIQACPPV